MSQDGYLAPYLKSNYGVSKHLGWLAIGMSTDISHRVLRKTAEFYLKKNETALLATSNLMIINNLFSVKLCSPKYMKSHLWQRAIFRGSIPPDPTRLACPLGRIGP